MDHQLFQEDYDLIEECDDEDDDIFECDGACYCCNKCDGLMFEDEIDYNIVPVRTGTSQPYGIITP